jgi:hypothetical protein
MRTRMEGPRREMRVQALCERIVAAERALPANLRDEDEEA